MEAGKEMKRGMQLVGKEELMKCDVEGLIEWVMKLFKKQNISFYTIIEW